jgi:hypothetical protein
MDGPGGVPIGESSRVRFWALLDDFNLSSFSEFTIFPLLPAANYPLGGKATTASSTGCAIDMGRSKPADLAPWLPASQNSSFYSGAMAGISNRKNCM